MSQSTTAEYLPATASLSKGKVFTITAHIARVILGLLFLVFGLNGFLHFIPMPPPTGTAAEFTYGLVKAPYLFPLMAFIQVVGGALLLTGVFVPFALLLLFPIILNIFFFHLTLAPAGLGLGIFVLAANILLAVYYREVYKPIFNTENAWKRK